MTVFLLRPLDSLISACTCQIAVVNSSLLWLAQTERVTLLSLLCNVVLFWLWRTPTWHRQFLHNITDSLSLWLSCC